MRLFVISQSQLLKLTSFEVSQYTIPMQELLRKDIDYGIIGVQKLLLLLIKLVCSL